MLYGKSFIYVDEPKISTKLPAEKSLQRVPDTGVVYILVCCTLPASSFTSIRQINVRRNHGHIQYRSSFFSHTHFPVPKNTSLFLRHRRMDAFQRIVFYHRCIAGVGIGIYFFAFVIEPRAPCWNIATLWDSCKNAFLVGILPFSFFTITNLHHLPGRKTSIYDSGSEDDETPTLERGIEIKSKLKKETLSFYPSEFLYAESDGN